MKQVATLVTLFVYSLCYGSNLSQFLGSSSGVTWVGYSSSTYPGNMGFFKGMNNICDGDYSGSHACTYEELVRLGNSYPYTQAAWVVDGSYYSWSRQVSKTGVSATSANNPDNPMCSGWSITSSSYYGPLLGTSGSMGFASCASSFYVPCCK